MKRLFRSAAAALALKMTGASLAFFFNILIARVLGAEGAGIFFISFTVVTIIVVFGKLGLDNTVLRFAASHASADDWRSVKGVSRKGLALAVSVTAGISLAVFLLAPFLSERVFSKPEASSPMRWMLVAAVPMVLIALHAELLKAINKVQHSLLLQVVLVWVFATAFAAFLGPSWGINGAVWAYAGACVLTAVLAVIFWRSATPQLKGLEGSFATGEMFSSCMPLYAIALMNLALNWLPFLLLSVWGTKAEVGIFGAAFRTAMLISFILVAVNSIVAHRFAAFCRSGDHVNLDLLARQSTKLLFVSSLPFLALFLLAPTYLMGFFGKDFTGGALVLSILAAGQFVNVATGSVGQLLVMSGNERLLRNNLFIAFVINCALNLALIPRYGMTGAAVATAVSISVQNIRASFIVWKTIKIRTLPWPSFI